MTLFNLLMWPSNAACDRLGLTDEQERSMVRMLVNTLLWTTVGAIALFAAWMAIA